MSLTPAFVTGWDEDVTQLAQQKKSKLMDTAMVHRNVKEKVHTFIRMAAISATTRADNSSQEVSAVDVPTSPRQAILTNHEVDIYIPKFDMLKINFDSKREYQMASVSAINRDFDDLILATLATSTNTTPTTTGSLTFAKIQEAQLFFDASDVDMENRILVLGSKQMGDLLAEGKFTSRDYTRTEGGVISGRVNEVLGFGQIIISNRLPLNAGVRTIYAYQKNGLGLAVGQDIKTSIDWVPHRKSWLVDTDYSAGSVIIDDALVVKILCQE